jgi:hypothetical protein
MESYLNFTLNSTFVMEAKSINIMLVSDNIGNEEQELALREEAKVLSETLTEQGFNPNINSDIKPFQVITKGTLLARIFEFFDSSFYISQIRPIIGKGYIQNYIRALPTEKDPTIIIGDFAVSYHNRTRNSHLFSNQELFPVEAKDVLYLAHWVEDNSRDQKVSDWLSSVKLS